MIVFMGSFTFSFSPSMTHFFFLRRQRRFLFLFLLAMLSTFGIATAQAPIQPWRWAVNTGSTQMGQSTAQQVAVTPQGETYVLGSFTGRFTFGNRTFQSVVGTWPASGGDVFLAKYDTAGALLWARQIGGDNEDLPAALATDVLGNAYVGVHFSSRRLVLGADTLLNRGGDSLQGYGQFTDLLLAKADGAGQWQWAQRLGGRNSDEMGGIVVDGVGDVYVAGRVADPDSVGGFTLRGESFVGKLDGGGQWQWLSNGGNPSGGGGAYALALAPGGTMLYAGGDFMDTGTFGNTVLVATPNGGYDYDGYVAALDAATGQWQWAQAVSGDGSEMVVALATDASGAVVAGGPFNGAAVTMDTITHATRVDFGMNPYGTNSFVGALSSGGQWLWGSLAGSDDLNNLTGLAVGHDGGVYVTGLAEDSASFGTSALNWPIADYNSYLARIDGATGTWQWALPLNEVPACGCGHLATQYAGVAIAPDGGLRLTSTYTDSARFGGLSLTGPLFFSNGSGQQQGYVVRFSDQLPILLRLAPASGPVGAAVTLTGMRFGSATQVLFNGVAAPFSVVSPTEIMVTVPPGATTGLVSVTTPAGTVNSPVRFRVNTPTGLTATASTSFNFWPNPAHDAVRLTLPAGARRAISLVDALGRPVLVHTIGEAQTEVTLPLAGLRPGVYTMRIGAAVRKLVVE